MRKDDLYGLLLEEFTPARDALAKELRQAGKKDAAEAVRALRKPPVFAWAVNQAVRRQPELGRSLAEAGGRLRKAQRKAVAGSGADDLRAATREHRGLVEELTDAAREALATRGAVSAGVLTKVAQTLRAASVDKEASKSLVAGTLAGEVEEAGFGALLSAVPDTPRKPRLARTPKAKAAPKPKAPPRPKPPPKPKRDPNAARRAGLERQLERARARVADLETKLRELGD